MLHVMPDFMSAAPSRFGCLAFQQPPQSIEVGPRSGRRSHRMAQPLAQAMRAFLGERLQCNTRVARVEIRDSKFYSYDEEDQLLANSRNLMLCCGAREAPLPELLDWRDKWEGSGRFLMRDRLDDLAERTGPVVIVGASHSAFSCAWRLLNDPLFANYAGNRDIVMLQRRETIRLRCTT